MIKKKPFVSYKLEEERKEVKTRCISVYLNEEEQKSFDQGKQILEQGKDSTCLKQLANIGLAILIEDKKTALIVKYLFKNKHNNKRMGIMDFEQI